MQLDNYNELVGTGINIYGSRERIRSQLIDFAKSYLQLETVDFYKTSVMSYIVDCLSILSANHLFYDSVIYREFFMVESQMQESVYNLARWIGYEVPKATASKVDLMFTLPLTFSQNETTFSIPNTFRAYANDIVFTVDSVAQQQVQGSVNTIAAALMIDKTLLSQLQAPGSAALGKIINNSAITVKDSTGFYRPIYLSTDGKYASFTLPFTQHDRMVFQFLVPSSLQQYQFFSKILEYSGMVSKIKVWVAEPPVGEKVALEGETPQNFDPNATVKTYAGNTTGTTSWKLWSESPHGVYTMAPGSNEYVLVSGINRSELFFGNGIIGKQPSANSAVTVELYITKGEDGQVIPYTVTKGDPISYGISTIYGNTPQTKIFNISYQITNTVQSIGGENTPTLPEIKRRAIINLRSKERLVSDLDYDNINTIMGPSFPVVESYPILKRSDLKVNEIMAFMRMMYHDELFLPQIVPTRNVKFPVYDPVFVDDKYTILRTTNIMVDNDYYQTLFNITINKSTMMAYYDYILQNIVGSPTILYDDLPYSWYQQYTYIPINTIDFNIVIPETYPSSSSSGGSTSVYPLKIRVNVNHIPSSNDNSYQFNYNNIQGAEIRCRMVTKWDNNQEYSQTYVKWIADPNSPLSAPYNTKFEYFEFEIPNYLNIPTEVQRYEFYIDGYGILRDDNGFFIDANGNQLLKDGKPTKSTTGITPVEGWIPINRYYSDTLVRKDLSDVMFSTVSKTSTWDGIYHPTSIRYDIHNVPTILSSYLDDGQGGGILNRSDNQQYPNFEVTVMQSLIKNLDVVGKRMLTDSINIKFPDTYGKLNNLRYNPVDDIVLSRYHTPFKTEDPSGIIFVTETPTSSSSSSTPTGTIKYIVNGEVPGFENNDLASYIDSIAELYQGIGPLGEDVWYLFKPKRGRYVRVMDELDSYGKEKVLVFNGDMWQDVQDFQIPLRIRLKVEQDPLVTMSGTKLKELIKDKLITTFSPYMGVQKPLDRSEISKAVRDISGVKYCEVISPEVDIRFNYELKDLTQEELIDYTPQYVGWTLDTIEIDIET